MNKLFVYDTFDRISLRSLISPDEQIKCDCCGSVIDFAGCVGTFNLTIVSAPNIKHAIQQFKFLWDFVQTRNYGINYGVFDEKKVVEFHSIF